MQLMARVKADGRLADIRRYRRSEQTGRTDLVPLARMPTDMGPLAYDPVTQLAVPAELTRQEKIREAAREVPKVTLCRAITGDQAAIDEIRGKLEAQ